MYGLASLLPEPYYTQVERIWDGLENCCKLTAIRETPYPHFSWHIARSYQMDQLDAVIQQLSEQIAPFQIRTAGLGIFGGVKPVIYIAVVKNEQLITLHRRIWDQLIEIANGPSPYYHPDNWMPHITLAYEDITPQNIGAVMQMLAFERYDWEMWIENLTMICSADSTNETTSVTGASIRPYPLRT